MKKLLKVKVHVMDQKKPIEIMHPSRSRDFKHLWNELTNSGHLVNEETVINTKAITMIECDMVDHRKPEKVEEPEVAGSLLEETKDQEGVELLS